ncbi:MAG: transglycosylase domain-containing protein [Gammaproteobacteria bacterium]|nr:MAG: transglycosylase domain-containing protein [Gammaproteobacteria bacterium]
MQDIQSSRALSNSPEKLGSSIRADPFVQRTRLPIGRLPKKQPRRSGLQSLAVTYNSRGKGLITTLVGLLFVTVVLWEMKSSTIQAHELASLSRVMSFTVEPGPSLTVHFPNAGPYDKRLGYTQLPDFLERLRGHGFAIERQTRFSPALLALANRGLFPPYREKDQAGLSILDRNDRPLFAARFPKRIYQRFPDIPPLIVATLLAIENRELLDGRPKRNPAIEWDRLFRAAMQYPLSKVWPDYKGPGGSTLATQLEKARHSPGGITNSVGDKLRQIASASLRAYLDGEYTLETQKQIVMRYLNSLPLAAVAGRGEIIGLAAGLEAWYGADVEEIDRRLWDLNPWMPRQPRSRVQAYKQVLSLLLAQRRPTYFLVQEPDALRTLTDAYLRILTREDVIGPELRDAALKVSLPLRGSADPQAPANARSDKTADIVRNRLATLFKVSGYYGLDRLDLTVESTLDRAVQQAVIAFLKGLGDPKNVQATRLDGPRLLAQGDPAQVIYSFSLYERGPGANWLRVQADNLEQPLNIAQGMKLDLGSTAKLRTLITYLQVVAELYQRFAGASPAELRSMGNQPSDALTRWVIHHLSVRSKSSLRETLEAAMERQYSASPYERFYTGSGVHTFGNFNHNDDGRILSVREAFRQSVNLVFIRLMRDIVQYYMVRLPAFQTGFVEDRNHWLRQVYLERFADQEGSEFLARFYRKYAGRTHDERLGALLQDKNVTARRLAVVLRSIEPNVSIEKFREKMRMRLPNPVLSEQAIADLYETYSVEQFNLLDRGYIARVHPLELWLLAYLRRHPKATLRQVLAASEQERFSVYRWLFKSQNKRAQDRRIKVLLEREAFAKIHHAWQKLGYPFGSLVPSYATAIGSSADRPAALAELIGIILSNGVRYPTRVVRRLRFGEGTPYETVMASTPSTGEPVLAPEVAAMVRRAMVDAVEQGTARRARGAFVDGEGGTVAIGGKTGTGDHRYKIYSTGARLLEARAVNRTATFVFFVGERFYGVVTAYVPGPRAAQYRFTSSLAVQLFRTLVPVLRPLIERPAA